MIRGILETEEEESKAILEETGTLMEMQEMVARDSIQMAILEVITSIEGEVTTTEETSTTSTEITTLTEEAITTETTIIEVDLTEEVLTETEEIGITTITGRMTGMYPMVMITKATTMHIYHNSSK